MSRISTWAVVVVFGRGRDPDAAATALVALALLAAPRLRHPTHTLDFCCSPIFLFSFSSPHPVLLLRRRRPSRTFVRIALPVTAEPLSCIFLHLCHFPAITF